MSDPLSTYLADHLAGSVHAIELVKRLRDEYHDDELGRFAANLLQDIEADQAVLQEVTARAGSGPSKLKDIVGWLGERRVLGAIASSNARLEGIDFDELARRAAEQHARVEERRLEIGRRTLMRHNAAA